MVTPLHILTLVLPHLDQWEQEDTTPLRLLDDTQAMTAGIVILTRIPTLIEEHLVWELGCSEELPHHTQYSEVGIIVAKRVRWSLPTLCPVPQAKRLYQHQRRVFRGPQTPLGVEKVIRAGTETRA